MIYFISLDLYLFFTATCWNSNMIMADANKEKPNVFSVEYYWLFWLNTRKQNTILTKTLNPYILCRTNMSLAASRRHWDPSSARHTGIRHIGLRHVGCWHIGIRFVYLLAESVGLVNWDGRCECTLHDDTSTWSTKCNERTKPNIDLTIQKLLKWEMRQPRWRQHNEKNENGNGHESSHD